MTTCEICGEKVPPVPSFSFGGTADFIHRCKNQRCERYNLPLESKTISDRERTCSWHIYNVERNAADWVEQAHRDFNAGWDARDEAIETLRECSNNKFDRITELEAENKRLQLGTETDKQRMLALVFHSTNLEAEVKRLREALERSTKYLDTHIAMLECISRVRTMDEECWELGMLLRDVGYEALKDAKVGE